MIKIDRRGFIAATAIATTAAAVARAADAPMKLSLSTRNVEGARNATGIEAVLPFEEFLKIAKTAGYEAISVRAAAGGLQTPLNRLYEMSRLTKAAGLKVSMVTPDFPVPLNNARAPECLRNITPYLNVAEIFECDQVRVAMKTDEDIVWAQRASDEARERKLRLVHHAEANTLFATFDVSLRTLKQVNRRNFGYLHDECQWMVNTKDYRPAQIVSNIKAVSPWLWNVYIKNQVSGPGPTNRPEIQLSAPGGVDWDRHFEGLNAIRYIGYVTVHESSLPYASPQDAATKCHDFLKPYTSRTAKT
jgi:sugar phosphate isomerase/epimerase